MFYICLTISFQNRIYCKTLYFLIDLSIIYACTYGSLLPDGSRDVVPGVTQVQPLRQINHRLPINVRYVRSTRAFT